MKHTTLLRTYSLLINPDLQKEKEIAVLGSSVDEDAPSRTIYVIALDLQEEPRSLMFEGSQQAVASGNTVVAVRTGTSMVPSQYICNGQLALQDLQAIRRPILSALLEAGWVSHS